MERDFMGLNSSKEPLSMVKEELVEPRKDPSSAFFKSPQVFNQNMEGGNQFSVTNYPIQQNAHLVHNQGISLSMNNPFFQTQFAVAGQNFGAAQVKPPYLGGIPITTPHLIHPSISSMAGTTEPWFSLKTSQTPAQMTIFYGGTVNVYDDISPEKAQAIMFLAGNGSSAASNVVQPRNQVQAPSYKPAPEDSAFVSKPVNVPCSGLSSPVSISSHSMRPSGVGNANNGPPKTGGGLATPANGAEAPNGTTSVGHVAVPTMVQSAVPQARKASLARFLEKRKERVMGSAPYNNLGKKSTECATPGSNGVAFSSRGSGLGSLSISTGKDNSH